jgi:putative flavoprotein involved in K+ transport
MQRIDTVVIGGSQAGLAMSRSLTECGVEHIVLERGRIGERWRSERWDSLRLLTPRWLSRIGGWGDVGADPEGFMDRQEVIRYLEAYAAVVEAPVEEGVTVLSVEPSASGFTVQTTRGAWRCDHVVAATGHSQHAYVPGFAASLDPSIVQVVPTEYRSADRLPPGGVLVVGGSATGLQLAEEIHASGRPVRLAVGRHIRLPRRYRDRDIMEWLHRMGSLDERIDTVRNPHASASQPSLQLVGTPDRSDLDLGRLQSRGVRLYGRALGGFGGRVWFDDDLIENLAAADFKLASLRRRIDAFVVREGMSGFVGEPDDFLPVPLAESSDALDLASEGIRTVVWATGFRRSYPWMHSSALDERGDLLHRGGVSVVPGLYALGLNFQRRRSSSFLVGVANDAGELSRHLVRRRSNLAGIQGVAA